MLIQKLQIKLEAHFPEKRLHVRTWSRLTVVRAVCIDSCMVRLLTKILQEVDTRDAEQAEVFFMEILVTRLPVEILREVVYCAIFCFLGGLNKFVFYPPESRYNTLR